MRYEEVVENVRNTCGLESVDAAHAVESILETLGERIPETHRKHLADQLSAELKDYLFKREHRGNFGPEEFYSRVAARENVHYRTAVERSRCVMTVLQQAASEGEWRKIRNALPDEYAELFGEPVESPLSPSAV